tara:strand:+ start:327 stop:554 length:228 start_codon:yes stop_codon:yes gene_type:complete
MIRFFTGPNCSACKVLKGQIDARGLTDQFKFIDVTVDHKEAMHYNIRGNLPVIVTEDMQYFLGLSDGIKLLNTLK